jgi:hypothetical protein
MRILATVTLLSSAVKGAGWMLGMRDRALDNNPLKNHAAAVRKTEG